MTGVMYYAGLERNYPQAPVINIKNKNEGKTMKIVEYLDKLLCRIELHRIREHKPAFYDYIGHKQVYIATCSCGKHMWLVDTTFPFPTFKVDRNENIGEKENVKVQSN